MCNVVWQQRPVDTVICNITGCRLNHVWSRMVILKPMTFVDNLYAVCNLPTRYFSNTWEMEAFSATSDLRGHFCGLKLANGELNILAKLQLMKLIMYLSIIEKISMGHFRYCLKLERTVVNFGSLTTTVLLVEFCNGSSPILYDVFHGPVKWR